MASTEVELSAPNFSIIITNIKYFRKSDAAKPIFKSKIKKSKQKKFS